MSPLCAVQCKTEQAGATLLYCTGRPATPSSPHSNCTVEWWSGSHHSGLGFKLRMSHNYRTSTLVVLCSNMYCTRRLYTWE